MRGLVPISRTVCRSDALQPSFSITVGRSEPRVAQNVRMLGRTPLVALSAGATRFSRRFRSQWGAQSQESLKTLECVDYPQIWTFCSDYLIVVSRAR